jgi:ArsR family transcriptional regulator, arsenate/arsenite/antimonite-responsive transcriptional repressor
MMPAMEKRGDFDFPLFFKALADNTRLRLLNLIGKREICVCYFVEILGTHQPKISRHLAYLRDAGIVEARREGKWMHYRLAQPSNPIAKQMLGEVLEWLKGDTGMKAERAKLAGICCSPRPPSRLKHAPMPQLSQITELDGF